MHTPRVHTRFPKGHQMVAESFYWDDAPTDELLAYVEKHKRPDYSGSWAVSKVRGDRDTMPQSYQDHLVEVFHELKYPVKEWRFWIGVTLPMQGVGGEVEPGNPKHVRWAKGFPHSHQWNALTAVHYVQCPADNDGGDLVIVDDEDHDLARFIPEVGMTCVIDGYTRHGVELVTGDTPRFTLIGTGFHA